MIVAFNVEALSAAVFSVDDAGQESANVVAVHTWQSFDLPSRRHGSGRRLPMHEGGH